MITCNIQKKTVVEKLLNDKKVTIEEAFLLLDDYVELPYPPIYPNPLQPYIAPYINGGWWEYHPATSPFTGPIIVFNNGISGTSIPEGGTQSSVTVYKRNPSSDTIFSNKTVTN